MIASQVAAFKSSIMWVLRVQGSKWVRVCHQSQRSNTFAIMVTGFVYPRKVLVDCCQKCASRIHGINITLENTTSNRLFSITSNSRHTRWHIELMANFQTSLSLFYRVRACMSVRLLMSRLLASAPAREPTPQMRWLKDKKSNVSGPNWLWSFCKIISKNLKDRMGDSRAGRYLAPGITSIVNFWLDYIWI